MEPAGVPKPGPGRAGPPRRGRPVSTIPSNPVPQSGPIPAARGQPEPFPPAFLSHLPLASCCQ